MHTHARRGPSFQDLVDSDQGHTVISMLLDVNGFWQYDNMWGHPSLPPHALLSLIPFDPLLSHRCIP